MTPNDDSSLPLSYEEEVPAQADWRDTMVRIEGPIVPAALAAFLLLLGFIPFLIKLIIVKCKTTFLLIFF